MNKCWSTVINAKRKQSTHLYSNKLIQVLNTLIKHKDGICVSPTDCESINIRNNNEEKKKETTQRSTRTRKPEKNRFANLLSIFKTNEKMRRKLRPEFD